MGTSKEALEGKVAALYGQYGSLIYARCRRLLKDDALAEDATQEVFIRVVRHISEAPDERSALPWLYRICTNYCLNALRDRKRYSDAMARYRPEPVQDFERQSVEQDFARKLVAATDQSVSEPALLHHVEGLKQGQVAKALGVCRRTVIYRLGRFVRDAQKFAEVA